MNKTPSPGQIWTYNNSLRHYRVVRQCDMKTNQGPTGWEAGVLYEAAGDIGVAVNGGKMFCRELSQFTEKFTYQFDEKKVGT